MLSWKATLQKNQPLHDSKVSRNDPILRVESYMSQDNLQNVSLNSSLGSTNRQVLVAPNRQHRTLRKSRMQKTRTKNPSTSDSFRVHICLPEMHIQSVSQMSKNNSKVFQFQPSDKTQQKNAISSLNREDVKIFQPEEVQNRLATSAAEIIYFKDNMPLYSRSQEILQKNFETEISVNGVLQTEVSELDLNATAKPISVTNNAISKTRLLANSALKHRAAIDLVRDRIQR